MQDFTLSKWRIWEWWFKWVHFFLIEGLKKRRTVLLTERLEKMQDFTTE